MPSAPSHAATDLIGDALARARAALATTPETVDSIRGLPRFAGVLAAIETAAQQPFAILPLPIQQEVVRQRLDQLVRIARLNPLWRQRIAQAGLMDGVPDRSSWEQLPLLDKDSFQAFYSGNRPGLVLPIDAGGFEIVASGGTSAGKPTETVYDLLELQETYAMAGAFMGSHLIPRHLGPSGSRWVATTLADYQMWSSGTMVGGVLQRIPGINYIAAGPMSREVFHHMMNYPGPKAIMGITQSIALLATFADGLDAQARSSFRLALYGSGMLTAKTRADLKAAYPDIAVASYFAATQAETIGLQLDPDSPMLATVPGLHLVEIVDDEGRSVPEGAEGELVVTRLLASEAPMLRYKVGDRVIHGPDLDTGTLRTMQFSFAGRSGDFMHIGDTQYNARQAVTAITEELRRHGIIDLDLVAREVQFVNDRSARQLHLVIVTERSAEWTATLARQFGSAGAAPYIMAGLVRSLSVFNSLEANEAAVLRSGYALGLRLLEPGSPELVRTEVGKIPLLVDRF